MGDSTDNGRRKSSCKAQEDDSIGNAIIGDKLLDVCNSCEVRARNTENTRNAGYSVWINEMVVPCN